MPNPLFAHKQGANCSHCAKLDPSSLHWLLLCSNSGGAYHRAEEKQGTWFAANMAVTKDNIDAKIREHFEPTFLVSNPVA